MSNSNDALPQPKSKSLMDQLRALMSLLSAPALFVIIHAVAIITTSIILAVYAKSKQQSRWATLRTLMVTMSVVDTLTYALIVMAAGDFLKTSEDMIQVTLVYVGSIVGLVAILIVDIYVSRANLPYWTADRQIMHGYLLANYVIVHSIFVVVPWAATAILER